MISQKNTMFKDMNGEQIVKKTLVPGVPVIYDPLGNRQLEAFENFFLMKCFNNSQFPKIFTLR